MCRAKTPGHKTFSSVVVAYLNVASSSVPSNPALFVSGREPGRGYISTQPTSAHAHHELHVESVCVCVMRCSRVAGCALLVLTAVFFFFFHVPFFVMNAEYGTRSSFRSGFCVWNGELGSKARFYLASFPGLLAPIFDRFTVCKDKSAHLHHDDH